ncbi:MAG: adenylate/guanylate cyclase domain-containing protein [Nitrospirae bacterium]|nr:adenylate/guanylate cyclase domain-containing protein [Nitrospirota bacterium]
MTIETGCPERDRVSLSAISLLPRLPSINNKGFINPTVTIPLLITFFFVYLTYINPLIIDEYLGGLFVDYGFKVRNYISPPDVPPDVSVVAIDENSLAEYGRWPWDRRLQAKLIDKVFEGDPRAVAVDIFYPESESPEADSVLAETISAHKDKLVMALAFAGEEGKKFTGELPDILYDYSIMTIKNATYLKAYEAYRALIPPEPIGSASQFGHVFSLPDRDGKLRWEYIYIKFGEEYFPSLAFRAALISMNIPLGQVKIIGGTGVEAGDVFVPTDLTGRLLVNYYGREGRIAHSSAADVLSGLIPPDTFRNKIVLIGTTAIATYDQKVTPFSANFSGVEKNATIVANIITGNYLTRMSAYADILIVLVMGLTALFIGQRNMSSLPMLAVYLAMTIAYIAFNQTLFAYYGLRANLIYPALTVFTVGTFIVNYRFFVEERKARNIRKMFSSYVTEKVVNELIKNPEMAKLGGDRRDVTIFFSDIRSFTTFSEKHQPEEVVAILNEYLGAMTDIVFKWEGTLDKFIGDAIVAFWGAPLPQENHAELALGCALDMVRKLKELQDKWRSEGGDVLQVGIGINTGEAIVGNIGAEGKKMDYTVIGDNVNLAARVESLTKRYNAGLLMTEFSVERIRESVEGGKIKGVSIEGVERVIVKGKDEPVGIYKVTLIEPDMTAVITDPEEGEVVKLTEK